VQWGAGYCTHTCHEVTTIVETTVLAVCPSNWPYRVGGTSHPNTTAMDVGMHFVCGTGSPLTHLMATALLGWGRWCIWGPLGGARTQRDQPAKLSAQSERQVQTTLHRCICNEVAAMPQLTHSFPCSANLSHDRQSAHAATDARTTCGPVTQRSMQSI